jgi:UDP-N-acetylmuramate dehydrogenase
VNTVEQDLKRIAGEANVICGEMMNRHTTFRIGGPADYFVTPQDEESLCACFCYVQELKLPYFVLGNGSNVLVSDEGFRGVVIRISEALLGVSVKETEVVAGAGMLLSKIAASARDASLTGMEFASGIPGTLGGAVMMNAGAYGGEMKDIIETVRVVTEDGTIRTIAGADMQFGYRTSLVRKKGWIVLSAVLRLEKGKIDAITARMNELKEARTSKQPLELPSAGSTFKRPTGYFAGKLIMDSNLAGFSVGGAQVSTKHCGFVVSNGNATAEDVYQLIRRVRAIVYEKQGVLLEPEVKFIGKFPPLDE